MAWWCPRNGATDVRILRHINSEQVAQLYATCTEVRLADILRVPVLEALGRHDGVVCGRVRASPS